MSKALSSAARRALIVSLINRGLIRSQKDLVKQLNKAGVKVTQATASRDLETIGAVRGPDNNGEVRYQMPNEISSSNPSERPINKISNNLILKVESSGNLVVIGTPPGAAQMIGGSIDRAMARYEIKQVIGTIAGDDTVLVIAKSSNGGAAAKRELLSFFDKNIGASGRVGKK